TLPLHTKTVATAIKWHPQLSRVCMEMPTQMMLLQLSAIRMQRIGCPLWKKQPRRTTGESTRTPTVQVNETPWKWSMQQGPTIAAQTGNLRQWTTTEVRKARTIQSRG